MRLDPIWNSLEAQQMQREIWRGQCPQCWTACEAYQSLLGNGLGMRRHPHHAVDLVPSAGSPTPSGRVR
jgi:hypothetical protein